MTNRELSIQFARFFKANQETKDEVIPWDEGSSVGFSVLRNYPPKGKFIPAKTENGKDDSVALIRVGYYPNGNETVPNIVIASKGSRYLLGDVGKFDYNFDDKDSPTKESLQQSKDSRQPVELEDNTRFEFDPKIKTFFDKEDNKVVSLNYVVDSIYTTHLKTVKTFSGAAFRIKLSLRERIIKIITLLIRSLKSINFKLLGKTIKEEKDFALGWFKKYPHKNLGTLRPEEIEINGYFLYISKNAFFTATAIILGTFIVHDLVGFELLFVEFLKENAGNQVFFVAFSVMTLWLFDYLLPHLILALINLLITSRLKISTQKINIK